MARRRVGGAPQTAAGDVWRQQQQLAVLAGVLGQLPRGDAVPLVLLRGLQRALACAEHTLQGPPSSEEWTSAAEVEADDAGAGYREGEAEVRDSAEQGQSAASREAVAAARVVGILRDVLASVSSGRGKDDDASGRGGSDDWCGPSYAESLLHHCLALSSDLLDGNVGTWSAKAVGAGATAAGGGWRQVFRRDELAAAARRRLPVSVYARVVATMGWEPRVLELLAWVPDGAVAQAALARALGLHPDITPALAAALINAAGWDSIASDGGGGDSAAGQDQGMPEKPSWWWGWARAVVQSPDLALRVAQVVRRAAAEAPGAASAAAAWEGRRWLPCLLLLARALAAALRRLRTAAAPDDAVRSGWAEACCEALQEGLCVCQADAISAVAADAAADATAATLLQLLQGELASLLDEQQLGVSGNSDAAVHGLPLLPPGPALRLRTRIRLLGVMQMAGSTAAAAGAEASPPPAAPGALSTTAAGSAVAAAVGASRLAVDDVWQNLPCGSAAAGPETSEPSAAGRSGRSPTGRLPGWFGAATAVAVLPPSPRRADALHLLLPCAVSSRIRSSEAGGPQAAPPAAPAPRAVATARAAAVAVALLTPGMASWLQTQTDPRVIAAAGPDPYSPFRVALALLELLHGLRLGSGPSDGPDRDAAGIGPGWNGPAAAAEAGRQLELCVLRMAAQCLACVGAPEQQLALQELVLGSSALASLRARLAADATLHAAAGRALVALSNRAAAVKGSLDRLALSAQQETQRLAAAATDLLPYAVLVPEACVRRLVLDGLTHPGQQPWVLQLLRCFAVAVAAAAPPPPGAAAAPAAPVLLACVRDVVLGEAARWLRTAAERRSLLGLLGGLLREGLLAPRQLLVALVEPGLSGSAEDGRRSVPQVHCAMMVAQLILGEPGAASLQPAAAYCPMTELAVAHPAHLLLAAAGALNELYDAYATGCRLDAAAIDIAAAVLERAVQLYGAYLTAARSVACGAGGGVAGALDDEGSPQQAELRELSEGCAVLPRRLLAVQLPLLELSAGSDATRDGEDDGDGDGGRSRALAASFAPTARWRPRSLRAADASSARAVVSDTLIFAISSAQHATAVRRALLDVAADAAASDEDEVVTDTGGAAADAAAAAARSVWSAWGEELLYDDAEGALAAAGPGREQRRGGAGDGAVARHVAATAARGLPQVPASKLLGGIAEAVGELLPTVSPEQARRLLLALLPAIVQAAGVAALHAAATEAPAAAVLSMEVLRTWLLAPVASSRGDGGGGDAAAVTMSMALSCRAAVVAMRSAAAEEGAPELLPAVADRCAAHLALLASRLAVASGSLAGQDDRGRSPTQAAAAARAQPARGCGVGGSGLQAAAVAVVLLSELCAVAGVAAELAAPGNERALDVWQAILLSVLQCLVAALAAMQREAAPPAANSVAVAPSTVATAQRLLRGALSVLGTLPSPAADVLEASLERLCEDHGLQGEEKAGHGGQSADGCGWLSAALHTVLAEDEGQ